MEDVNKEIARLWPLSENYEYAAELGLALRQALPMEWKNWENAEMRQRFPLPQSRGFEFFCQIEKSDPSLLQELLPSLLHQAPNHMQEEWQASLQGHQSWTTREDMPPPPSREWTLWAPEECCRYSSYSETLWNWTKEALPGAQWQEGSPAEKDYLARIHDGNYLRGLQLLGEAGGGFLTPETECRPWTWDTLLAAAGATREAALHTWQEGGLGLVFSVPGSHHAGRSQARGTCFVHHLALAAEDLRRQPGLNRIALLDIDAHHGNGSEEIFFSRGDVLTVSVHQAEPFFPGTGSRDAIGTGSGKGRNKNIPVSPEESWIAAIEQAVSNVKNYNPDMLLVQWGADAHWDDHASDLRATYNDFRAAGELLWSLQLPTLLELGASTSRQSWVGCLRSFLA